MKVIVTYYLTHGRVVSEHEQFSDGLWELLTDLQAKAINYQVTFRKGSVTNDEE